MAALVESSADEIHCPAGGFHVDPCRPVALAVITHAHADHVRGGCGRYLCSVPGVELLRQRLGPSADILPLPYRRRLPLGAVELSLHPAGHILGSAQVRIEGRGEVWVASGDYKRDPDPTCAPFEVVPCDVFITEATFARPAFRWPPPAEVFAEMLEWWRDNRRRGLVSLVACYSLGKAERILAELGGLGAEQIWIHGALARPVEAYRRAGIELPATPIVRPAGRRPRRLGGELILAPPAARGGAWMERVAPDLTGFASGWMSLPDVGRRHRGGRGFILSDHADWPGVLRTVDETGARRVLVAHGDAAELVRCLRQRGLEAEALPAPNRVAAGG